MVALKAEQRDPDATPDALVNALAEVRRNTRLSFNPSHASLSLLVWFKSHQFMCRGAGFLQQPFLRALVTLNLPINYSQIAAPLDDFVVAAAAFADPVLEAADAAAAAVAASAAAAAKNPNAPKPATAEVFSSDGSAGWAAVQAKGEAARRASGNL